MGQCGDLTHAQLLTIINGVIEGLITLREEGNQNDYHRAGQHINNVIYPYVFEEHFGHPPPGHHAGGSHVRKGKRTNRRKSWRKKGTQNRKTIRKSV